ncbi:hypothetical protein ACVXZZ_14315 [Staphylococcus aureus]
MEFIIPEKYAETYPELAEEFKLAISGKLPKNYKELRITTF